MSSKEAPYATMHDLPKYQEREKVGSAPWEKDQRPIHNTNSQPHYFPSSQTAPFATSDNLPIPRQDSHTRRCRKLELQPPSVVKREQEGRMVNESPNPAGQKPAAGLHAGTQENRQKTSTAPWDRDETHYSAKIKCGSSAKSAPFATELNQK